MRQEAALGLAGGTTALELLLREAQHRASGRLSRACPRRHAVLGVGGGHAAGARRAHRARQRHHFRQHRGAVSARGADVRVPAAARLPAHRAQAHRGAGAGRHPWTICYSIMCASCLQNSGLAPGFCQGCSTPLQACKKKPADRGPMVLRTLFSLALRKGGLSKQHGAA